MWRGCLVAFLLAAGAAEALTLTGVTSRKTHGATGVFDLTIDPLPPLTGGITVEPRNSATATVVFQFDETITNPGMATLSGALGPVGMATARAAGREVIVDLTGVPEKTRVTVSLAGVNGALNVQASVGFLRGDVDRSISVNVLDISAARARAGQAAASANFVFDVDASGSINIIDIAAARALSGQGLAAPAQVGLAVSVVDATGTSMVTAAPLASGQVPINCGPGNMGACSASLPTGSVVTLSARADPGQVFTGWNGAGCSGTGPCAVTMSAFMPVTATFRSGSAPTLNVSVAGRGTVSSSGGSSNVAACDSGKTGTAACTGVFNSGATAIVTATPAAGYALVRWLSNPGGITSCASAAPGPCSFTKSAGPQYLTAVFAPTTPGEAPAIIYQDVQSGPITGGEDNHGIYVSLFGKNFGAGGLGNTVKVYFNNVEAAAYKVLGASRGRTDIQQVTVQPGALYKPADGTDLAVTVIADGRMSTGGASFKVNPGTIYFVSAAGSDSTGKPGDIAAPYRTVQFPGINNNGVAGCPAANGNQAVLTAGVWGLVRPGDFIVMRGGTWTDVGKDGFFLRAQNKSGTVANGSAGTGPIAIIGYPGETPFINRTNTVNRASGGGISSADTARQQLGCGARILLANLKIESGFNDGIVTTQNGTVNPAGSHWRVVNNEMTAVSCQNNDNCKGAGVAGSGLGQYWVGNYVHDVYDKPGNNTDFENHGFYMDGVGSYEIAFNRIENIYGGNGIQTNSTSSPNTNNAVIHHNLVNGVGKHGINLAAGTSTGVQVYNNVVYNTDIAGIRFDSSAISGAKIYNNTFWNTDRLNMGGYRAAVMNDNNAPAGAFDFRNNIVVPNAASRKFWGGSVGFTAANAVFSNNLWHNGSGTPPPGSLVNVLADPLFSSLTAGAVLLRPLLTGVNPAVDAGSATAASLVTTDFDFTTTRPKGSAIDIGAYER